MYIYVSWIVKDTMFYLFSCSVGSIYLYELKDTSGYEFEMTQLN